jgi:hypothetical protein
MAFVASLRGIQFDLPASASAPVAAEAARGPFLGTHVRRPFRGPFTRSQALALFDSAVFSKRICCNAWDLSSLLGYARTPPPDLGYKHINFPPSSCKGGASTDDSSRVASSLLCLMRSCAMLAARCLGQAT